MIYKSKISTYTRAIEIITTNFIEKYVHKNIEEEVGD
jgi:hypothetical protein